MGFDESTLAYDLQRAHSADIWFLRARIYIWGAAVSVGTFLIGHALPLFGVNLYSIFWDGFVSFWNHLWG